jgi:hypothetical protein
MLRLVEADKSVLGHNAVCLVQALTKLGLCKIDSV